MSEEEIIENAAVSYSKPVIIASVIIGIGIGGYFIYKKFFNKDDEDGEREVAYTYEEAVEKAKSRLDSGLSDDGVKLIPEVDKPILELHQKATYEALVEDLKKKDDEEEENAERKYVEIDEEIFKYGNPYNLKYKGSFNKKMNTLDQEWTESFDEIDEGELVDELASLCSEKDVEVVYLTDDAESIDYEITVYSE